MVVAYSALALEGEDDRRAGHPQAKGDQLPACSLLRIRFVAGASRAAACAGGRAVYEVGTGAQGREQRCSAKIVAEQTGRFENSYACVEQPASKAESMACRDRVQK